jgi:PKD repeat protein
MERASDISDQRLLLGVPRAPSSPIISYWKIWGRQLGFALAVLLGCLALAGPAEAQDKRAGNTFYVRAGASISDYAGDADGSPGTDDVTDVGDFLFDTTKFTEGGVFPYALAGEVGYRFSPAFDVGLSYRFGQYAFIHGRPFTTREGPPGKGGDLGTVRHTIQVLGRYTFNADDWTVAPYLDGGVNATFGGRTPGFGPSVGIGVDVLLSDHTSLFLEARSSIIIDDDAVDGIETATPVDALTEAPALGVRYNVRSPKTPPRLLALDCPTDVRTADSVSFTARINAEEASRPVEVRWSFGDGRTATGRTVSHTYGRPGTYDVTVTARNEAGTARTSCSVVVKPVPEPPVIAAIDATPNPAQECDTVRFEAEVEGDRPIEYEWQFGDGMSASSPSVERTYSGPGEYTARLAASNEHGTDRDSVTVQVQRPAICATVQELNAVFFAPGTSKLTGEARQKLRENAEVLRKCPNLQARIEGVAAPGEPSPQALSEARAEAVATFYEGEGLSPESLQIVGTGAADGMVGKKGAAKRLRKAETVPVQVETDCP